MISQILIDGYRVFNRFEIVPSAGMNIIVGDNDAGKSTLLEAISLALTGRINGRWAQDALDPYWFNTKNVESFFASLDTDTPIAQPEILIEVYFDSTNPDMQALRGVHNSQRKDCPGISLRVEPSAEYQEELKDYFADPDRPHIIPTEWYTVDWRDFADSHLTRRPKGLGVARIDSRTIRSSAGVDYHTREILADFIAPEERASIAVAHRKARHDISTTTLTPVNERIAERGRALHDKPIGLQMDQSSSASWETAIAPTVADVPFAMAGHGQQAAIKVVLAMDRAADNTAFALIEEPENHLSHTSLAKLVSRIEDLAGARQIFITTHSSYVLNRLGLDKLILISSGRCTRFADLPPSTVSYFKKLSGYDTMRIVLAEKVVLVEGPTDEMVFERAFRDKHEGKHPMQLGVDVVSMAGVSLKRGLQLCAALDRQGAAIRDNDGKDPSNWRNPLERYLSTGRRDLFIGPPANGKTLEPQFIEVNDEEKLRELLSIPDDKTTLEWMSDHKTTWGLKLLEADTFDAAYPDYILHAVDFVS